PDVPISGIRLSDWLHRRLTPARLLAPGVVGPPTSHTPVPRGTGGCLAKTPCAVSHGPLQPEQEAVVEIRRIVTTVFVDYQRRGKRAQLQQTAPVEIRARQS